jgi:hypothetical protein
VIAKHLGYGGLNGASIKMISAISKYGLLEEDKGDKVKVSPLAISILFPSNPEEKAAAIREAAFKPVLFTEIANEWPNGNPSDENMRAYLMRKNFATDAVDRVIQAYRDTIELVTRESGHYTPPPLPQGEGDRKLPPNQALQRPYATTYTPASGGEPFRVSFTGNGIEISGRITSPESAEELVRAVNALKLLLKPVAEVETPSAKSTNFHPGDIAPVSGNYHMVHGAGHKNRLRMTEITMEAGRKFPACEGCGRDVSYQPAKTGPQTGSAN